VRSHMLKSLAIGVIVFAVTLSSVSASAQDPTPVTTTGDQANGNIAGTIGLGLLGAEVGLLLPPLFKLHHEWWAWAVFPTVGAAGGVVAGLLAFDAGSPSVAVTAPLLGAGLALAIPAIVGSLALKDKRENGELEQRAEAGGLLRLSRTGGRMAVPSVGSAPVYSAAEQQRFGLNQRTAVRISLLSARF
jgi:hypothetical protein